jgi:hypothetical protein
MSAKEHLCDSKNGEQIYYDPMHSHAVTHFKNAPQLKALVIEVLENRELDDTKTEFDIDMGRIIGTTNVVEVDRADEIVYAIRKNRKDQGYVPFTKSREAQPSSFLSISLVAQQDGSYELSSAWVGSWDDPPFPQEPHATQKSKDYWNKHAFVWGSHEIEPGTERTARPW